MEKEDNYIEDTKKKIRSLLLSVPVGLTLKELVRDYNDFLGEPIPFSKCGYASLDEMLIEFTDVLRVDNNNGVACFTAVADDSTKHIEKLVSKQKLTKPFKWQTIKSNRRSETAARYSPHSRKGISRKNKNWLEKSTRKKPVPNISFCTRRRSLALKTKKQNLLQRTPHRTTRLASISSTKSGLKSPLSSGRGVRTPEHNKADVSSEKRTSPNSHVPSSLRKNIILLMKIYPSGIPLEDFEAAFYLRFKTRLNISCFRFRSITELLSNMQDVVNVRRQGREMFVLPVKDTLKKLFQTSRKTHQKQIERFTEPKNSNGTKNKIEESFAESRCESESKKKKPKTSDQTSARKYRRQSLKSLKKTNYIWSTRTEPSTRLKRLSSRGRKSYSGNDSLSLTSKRWKRNESRRLYSDNIDQTKEKHTVTRNGLFWESTGEDSDEDDFVVKGISMKSVAGYCNIQNVSKRGEYINGSPKSSSRGRDRNIYKTLSTNSQCSSGYEHQWRQNMSRKRYMENQYNRKYKREQGSRSRTISTERSRSLRKMNMLVMSPRQTYRSQNGHFVPKRQRLKSLRRSIGEMTPRRRQMNPNLDARTKYKINDLVRSTSFSEQSKLEGITKYNAVTVDNLQKCLLSWKQGEEGEIIDVVKYLMGCLVTDPDSENPSTEPVSLVVTDTDIVMVKESHQWPIPRFQAPLDDGVKGQQFYVKDSQRINNIATFECCEEDPTQLKITFCNEESQEEVSWYITMVTLKGVKSLVGAIREPWENEFGVNLDISSLSFSDM